MMSITTTVVAMAASAQAEDTHALDVDAVVGKLASGDLGAVGAAVTELADSKAPRGAAILRGLAREHLEVDADGRLFIRDGHVYVLASTGQHAEPKPPLRVVTVNNVIRRDLESAVARLDLVDDNAATRLRAATELAQHPDDSTAELVRPLIANEPVPAVKKMMQLVVAKVDVVSPSRERRLAIARVVTDSSDVSLKDTLVALTERRPDGTYGEPDEEVRHAYAAALSAINRRLLVIRLSADAIYGLSLGSVLLLAALGLAITFGLMGVINMAHGEMLMIGAYVTFVIQNAFAKHASSLVDLYIIVAVPAAFIVTACVGIVLERTVIRFLYGRPLETLLATWGLSLLMIQSVRTLFGAQNVTVANPRWLAGGWELMPTLVVPYSRIAVMVFTTVVVAFVWLVLKKTRLGLSIRAVTQNREMAASLGVPTKRIDTMAFALGSGVAGLGGVALSQLGNVGPELGQQHIIDSFMVVVVGGVGNVLGTVFGALGLGMVGKFLEPSLGAVLGKILILALLILFIQWRPQGLFALKGRSHEG